MTETIQSLLKLIVKLLAMSLTQQNEELKRKVLTTEKMYSTYKACDGFKTIPEIVKAAGYSSATSVEDNLPKWESQGLLISVGHGTQKRYLAPDNIPAFIEKMRIQPELLGE